MAEVVEILVHLEEVVVAVPSSSGLHHQVDEDVVRTMALVIWA